MISDPAYHPLTLLHVDLIAEDHKREALGILWACLNQELIAPTVKGIEALRVVDVVYQDTAVGATIEGDSQRLEAFLAGGVPQLYGN